MDKLNEENFSEITSLLKEAKPLYKARKKRARAIKATLLLFIPMFIITGFYNVYLQGEEVYLSLLNNNLQIELTQDEFGLYR